jgi:uncharacterized damage-inducible protein DinB
MKTFYKDLFEYSHQMNQKLITLFSEHSSKTSEYSIKLMSHILNANNIWNQRIEKREEPYKVWQMQQVQDFKSIDLKNFRHSYDIAETSDFEKQIRYVNSQGVAYTNTVKDILFHIINHSNYHRAQITSDFKRTGIEPPITDFIAYKR